MARLLILFLLCALPALAAPLDEFHEAITYFEYEKARQLAGRLEPPARHLALAEVAARTGRLDVAQQNLALVDPQKLPPELTARYLLVRALQARGQRSGGLAPRREATQRFLRDGLRQATAPSDRAALLLFQIQQSRAGEPELLEETSLELAEVEGVDDFLVLQAQALVAASKSRRAEAAALYRTLAKLAEKDDHPSARLLMANQALDQSRPSDDLAQREALLQSAFQLQDAETAREIWRGFRRRASEAQVAAITASTMRQVLRLPDSPAKLRFLDDFLALLEEDDARRLAAQAEALAGKLNEPAIALFYFDRRLGMAASTEEVQQHLELGRERLQKLPQEGLESSWYGDLLHRFGPRDAVFKPWTVQRLEERLAQSDDPRERNEAYRETFFAAYNTANAQLLERAFLGGLEDAVQAPPDERRELVGRLRREFLRGVVNEGPDWPDQPASTKALRTALSRKLANRPELVQAVLDSLLEEPTSQPRRLAGHLQTLSWWLRSAGRTAEARELLEQAVEQADPSSRLETRIPESLANLLLEQGDPAGLSLLAELAPQSDEGSWTPTVLGYRALQLGQTQEAERWLRGAVSQLPNDPPRLKYNLWARRVLALSLSRQGRHDEALEVMQEAEREEREIPEGNIYRDNGRWSRIVTARVLLEADRPAEAAALLNQDPLPEMRSVSAFELELRRDVARARGNAIELDAISTQVAGFLQQDTSLPDDPDFRSAWRNEFLGEPMPKNPPASPPELTLSELVENLERLRRREPRARELRGLAAADLKTWMEKAQPGEVYVQPVLLEHSLLLLTLRDGRARLTEIFCDRPRMDKALSSLEAICSSPESNLSTARSSLEALAQHLVWPWATKGTRSVRWMARGRLAGIPLAALPLPDGQPLISVADITVLDGPGESPARVGPKTSALLVSGASDLTGSSEELKAVRQLFPQGENWKLGEDHQRLKELSAEHSLLHISTHGLTPDGQHLGGQLQGDGRSLSAFQLAELELPEGSLAVLAACESSVGAATGRDNSSLVSALRTAGAAQVIGSLWPLDDTVTAQLFGHFYRSLHDGATPAAALAQAQRAIARDYPHPYYWAGLELVTGP